MKNFLTTAIQRAYEAGAEERDTYWKERVLEWVKENESYDEWGDENPHIFANDLREFLTEDKTNGL